MIDDNISVKATSRSVFGKGASRRLRRENLVPAILYGDGKEPQAIQLPANEVWKYLDNEAFYSQLLALSVDGGEPVRSILKDVQRHPYKQQILHMDFMRVTAGAELQVAVPLHFINEDVSIGAKAGGIIIHNENEVTVACRPRDIPEYIEVDMAKLDIGDSVHLSSLNMPAGVRLVDLHEAGDDFDRQLAAINSPRVDTEASSDEDAADESGDSLSGDDS